MSQEEPTPGKAKTMRKARDPIPYLLHPFQETSRSSSAVSVTSKTETEIFPQGSTSNVGSKVFSPKEDPTPGDDFTCRVTYLHLDENNHNWEENENRRDDNQENTIYGWICTVVGQVDGIERILSIYGSLHCSSNVN